jgi:tetratricopeptide (TPR) repeat protein
MKRGTILITLILSLAAASLVVRPVAGAADKGPNHRDGEKAIRKGDYEKAIKTFLRLIDLDGSDVRARLGLSLAYLKLQNYSKTFEQANEVIKIDEKSARAYAILGVAVLRSGYFDQATSQLTHALTLNSKEPLAYGGLAEIDYYENRAGEARQKATYAATLDPNEADYLHTLARASSRLEMFTDAADAYERFLQVAPKTDVERRDRIRGLIQFYRRIAGMRLHHVGGPKTVDVPFSLGGDRRPYIQVKVNGRLATFVIDTGSGFTVISDAAAKRLKVSVMAKGGNSQGFGGDGKFPIVYGVLGSLNMGEVKIDSVPCFIRRFHVLKDKPKEEHADGFVGLSVLSNFITELDYQNKVMRLTRFTEDYRAVDQRSPGTTVVPFRTTQNGLISIETQLEDGHQINAILDSGASSTVISMAAVDRLKMRDNVIKGQTVQVIGAAGVAENVELLFIRNCQVANLQQNNLRALILDFATINEFSGFEQSGILGGDFLRHFRLTIDFPRAQLTLEPQTTAIIKHPTGSQ